MNVPLVALSARRPTVNMVEGDYPAGFIAISMFLLTIPFISPRILVGKGWGEGRGEGGNTYRVTLFGHRVLHWSTGIDDPHEGVEGLGVGLQCAGVGALLEGYIHF